MREIDVKQITQAVKDLFITANKILPDDLCDKIKCAKKSETNLLGKDILGDLLLNLDCAKELDVPICQDTGMAIIFMEIGQDVHFVGGDFNVAINEGVKKAYIDGNLRCSIVSDPIKRINTNDNTPAVVHINIVSGEKVKILAAPKGFGSENMSGIKMFTPSATREDIIDFVCEIVKKAGSNPCPPMVIGVGIGGDFESSAINAKRALCSEVSKQNENDFYAEMETDMLKKINKLNIGVQGFGGDTTALAVKIIAAPTHIAGLPVAVNIGCHVTRHAEIIL